MRVILESSVHRTKSLQDSITLCLGGPIMDLMDNCEVFRAQFLSGLSLADLMKMVLIRLHVKSS